MKRRGDQVKERIPGVAAVWIALGGSGLALASSMPAPGPQEIVQKAEVVVVGTLGGVEQEPDATQGPHRYQWFWKGRLAVQEVLKGEPKSSPLPLRFTVIKSAKGAERPASLFPDGRTMVWVLNWQEAWQAYVPASYAPRDLQAFAHLDQVRQWVAGSSAPPIPPPPPPVRPLDLGITWASDKTQLIVAAIRPSSAAAEGKFQKADVLLMVEETAVATPQTFRERVLAFDPGQRLKISIERAGAPLNLWLVVPAMGAASVTPAGLPFSMANPSSWLTKNDVQKAIEKFYGIGWSNYQILAIDYHKESITPKGTQTYYIVRVREKSAPPTMYREIKVDARTGLIEAEQ